MPSCMNMTKMLLILYLDPNTHVVEIIIDDLEPDMFTVSENGLRVRCGHVVHVKEDDKLDKQTIMEDVDLGSVDR